MHNATAYTEGRSQNGFLMNITAESLLQEKKKRLMWSSVSSLLSRYTPLLTWVSGERHFLKNCKYSVHPLTLLMAQQSHLCCPMTTMKNDN